MSPLDRAWKPGFSPDTSVFSALETFVIIALYKSTFTIPYQKHCTIEAPRAWKTSDICRLRIFTREPRLSCQVCCYFKGRWRSFIHKIVTSKTTQRGSHKRNITPTHTHPEHHTYVINLLHLLQGYHKELYTKCISNVVIYFLWTKFLTVECLLTVQPWQFIYNYSTCKERKCGGTSASRDENGYMDVCR